MLIINTLQSLFFLFISFYHHSEHYTTIYNLLLTNQKFTFKAVILTEMFKYRIYYITMKSSYGISLHFNLKKKNLLETRKSF